MLLFFKNNFYKIDLNFEHQTKQLLFQNLGTRRPAVCLLICTEMYYIKTFLYQMYEILAILSLKLYLSFNTFLVIYLTIRKPFSEQIRQPFLIVPVLQIGPAILQLLSTEQPPHMSIFDFHSSILHPHTPQRLIIYDIVHFVLCVFIQLVVSICLDKH